MGALQEVAAHPVLTRFMNVTSSASGLDSTFRIIVYSLMLASESLARHDPKHPLVLLLQRLRTPISDARVTMRVFGTIPSLHYLFTPKYNSSPLLLLQNASMLVYYPAELVYWLAVHKAIDLPPATADRWSRISCMGWAAWIALEIVRLAREWVRIARERRRVSIKLSAVQRAPVAAATATATSTAVSATKTYAQAAAAPPPAESTVDGDDSMEKEAKLKRAQLDTEFHELRIRMLAQLSDLVMAVHWSLPTYPVPNLWVGFFGVIGSLAAYSLRWKHTPA
ncbi:hypothetical protein RI367_006017 [Sorochytrium milnesiophthora]